MTRTPLMAGNWKMNLTHQEAVVLVQKLSWTLNDKKHDYAKAEVVVLPPFTDIRSVQTLVDGDQLSLGYGAQDVSAHESGAYTGEISAAMLAKLGCSYVCVGHSERREYHEESDDLVNAKAKAALAAGMTPIVCVGEPLPVRQEGQQVPYTLAQLDGSLAGLSAEQVGGLVVAYEPVWAIGTGEVATPDDAQEVCARCTATPRRTPYACCTAARSRPRTSPGSWRRPTSTDAWWAGRACRPTSSAASAGSTTCPSCEPTRAVAGRDAPVT
jgi:triosephosphate isomerase (TIM)